MPCHPLMIGAAFLRKGGKEISSARLDSYGLLRGALLAGKNSWPLPIVYNSYIINRIMSYRERA